jgi:6-phospho-3-hexuloisomerase
MEVNFHTAVMEIAAVLDAVDEAGLDSACDRIARARRTVLYGCGREGLMMKGLAMRLYHLGLDAHVQGEMTCPPVGSGDLFFASAGPGHLATVTALLDVARAAGAETLLLTAEPTRTAGRAGAILHLPAQTMARDTGPGHTAMLPMGSVFEGAMFLVFEVMVLRLRDRLGVTPEAMRARHTNLE